MRPWHLLLALVLAFAGGWWLVRPPTTEVTVTSLAWGLKDLQGIGELRVLAARISVFEKTEGFEPGRRYAGVVPVCLVLGVDLAQANLVEQAGVRRLVLPPVRALRRVIDPDPAARFDWDAAGDQQRPGESISLPRLAELQGLRSAELEAERLGLFTKARTRTEALVRAWLTAGGMADVVIAWR